MDYDNEDQQAVEVDPSYAQLHSRVGIDPETAASRKERVTGVPAAGDDWERNVKKLAADVWGRWLADILIDETSGDVATGLDNGPGTKRYLSAQERIAILRAALRALAKANGYLPNYAWGSMPAPVPEPGFVVQMVK